MHDSRKSRLIWASVDDRRTHASSASCDASIARTSLLEGVAQDVGERAVLCSSSRCGKFTVKPDCVRLKMKQFGKPRVCMPCSVDAPSAHFSVSVDAVAPDDLVAGPAGVVGADLEAGGVDEAVELVLGAADDDAALGDPLDARAVGVDERDVRAG